MSPNRKKTIPTQSGFVFDPDSHSYYMDGKEMTGMTTILGVLAKPALIQWAANMAVEYVRNNRTLEMDFGGEPWEKMLEEARVAHRKKKEDAAEKGVSTHALVEEYVKACIESRVGKPALLEDARWNPIKRFAEWAVNEGIIFLASEQQVYSKELFVAGTFDLLFEKDGKRYMGDIKTYKKIWDRVPFFQCAGYSYCWEEMSMEGKDEHLNWSEKIDGYCIINLPKEREFNPEEDVMWSWDTEGDTKSFLACVTLYRQLATFKDYQAIIKSKKTHEIQ